MPILRNFCSDWTFKPEFEDAWATRPIDGTTITLPHNAVDLPFDYFDEQDYQKKFTYQIHIDWSPDFAGKELSLVFDGAMANSQVYIDGHHVGGH